MIKKERRKIKKEREREREREKRLHRGGQICEYDIETTVDRTIVKKRARVFRVTVSHER